MSKKTISKDLAELASKLSKKHSGEILLAKSVSFRLPVDLFAWLVVMSDRAGESRTDLLNNMVRSSVADLLKSLDKGTAQMLKTQQIETMNDIVRQYNKKNLGDLFQEDK